MIVDLDSVLDAAAAKHEPSATHSAGTGEPTDSRSDPIPLPEDGTGTGHDLHGAIPTSPPQLVYYLFQVISFNNTLLELCLTGTPAHIKGRSTLSHGPLLSWTHKVHKNCLCSLLLRHLGCKTLLSPAAVGLWQRMHISHAMVDNTG